METPRTFIYALGVDRVAERLGKHPGRVRQAAGADRLPASWFAALRDLASEDGMACDESLFSFDLPSSQGDAA